MFKKQGNWYRAWRLSRRAVIWKIRGGKDTQPLKVPMRSDPHYEWWEHQLYGNLRKLISSGTGGVPTVVIGYVSIAIVIFSMAPKLLPESMSSWHWVAAATAVAVVLVAWFFGCLVFYTAFVALRAISPGEYAKTVLTGLPPKDAIMVAAFDAQALCEDFLDITAGYEALLESCYKKARQYLDGENSTRQSIKNMLVEIKKNEALLKSLQAAYATNIAIRQASLERISATKEELASKLGISRRRLCDHILEYSPSIHAIDAEKFSENWNHLLKAANANQEDSLTPTIGDSFLARLAGLVVQSHDIRQRLEFWKDCQQELLDHGDPEHDGHVSWSVTEITKRVLEFLKRSLQRILRRPIPPKEEPVSENLLNEVQRFASQHSTSGSVMRYAGALAAIADSAIKDIEAGGDSDDAIKQCARRLLFLYRKHRVYLGIELHGAALTIASAIVKGEAPEDDDGSTAYGKEPCGHFVSVLEAMKAPSQSALVEVVASLMTPRAENDPAPTPLRSISTAPVDIEKSMAVARNRIVDNCVNVVTQFFDTYATQNDFIITAGYSKTVREGLVRGLPAEFTKRLRILVITESADSDIDALRMRQEIEKCEDLIVGMIDESMLDGLVRQQDRVLLLLGAERFDNKMRVAHPRLGRRGVDSIRERLDRIGCSLKTVSLAEEYKFTDDLLGGKDAFRHNRLDTLVVHTADVLISDKLIRGDVLATILPGTSGV